jgi:hypothetical protein
MSADYSGWEAFCDAFGALSDERLSGVFVPLWLPNPLLWLGVACLLAGWGRPAGIAGVVASLLASWKLRQFPQGVDLAVGAGVWWASMIGLAVIAWSVVALERALSKSPGR